MVEINLTNWQPIAKAAYEAYGASVGFKSFHGEQLKKWEELGDRIQQAWITASKKATEKTITPKTIYSYYFCIDAVSSDDT